jgi:hypothetical protein
VTWNMSKRDAMAHAACCDIPPADAEKMWTKYVELGAQVDEGTKADADALAEFGEFCTALALARITGGARP